MASVPDTRSAISGALLAAGSARRMGEPKLLLPWNERPLIRHVAEVAHSSLLADLVVVTGSQATAVEAALHGLPIRIVHNPDHASGLASSLCVGVRSVPAWAAGILIMLGDQPLLTAGVINLLLEAFARSSALVVAPAAAGRRGNPVLFARALFPELLAVSGDQGARAVIEANRADLELVEVEPSVFHDIDTPTAYAALKQAYGGS